MLKLFLGTVFISILLLGCVNTVKEGNLKVHATYPSQEFTKSSYEKSLKSYFNEHKTLFDKKYGYREVNFKFGEDMFLVTSNNLENKLIVTKNYKRLFNSYRPYFSKVEIQNFKKRSSLTKYEKELLSDVENIGFVSFSTLEEKKMLLEQIVIHELGHLYFLQRNKPNYIAELNFIGNKNFRVGMMRDEIYADLLSLIIMREKYGNDPKFIAFLDKLSKIRISQSVTDALDLDGNYNLYVLFKNLNLNFNSNDLTSITKYVDAITLKTLKMFGIEKDKNVTIETMNELYKRVRRNVRGCQYHYPQTVEQCYNYTGVNEEVNESSRYLNYEEIMKHKLDNFLEENNIN